MPPPPDKQGAPPDKSPGQGGNPPGQGGSPPGQGGGPPVNPIGQDIADWNRDRRAPEDRAKGGEGTRGSLIAQQARLLAAARRQRPQVPGAHGLARALSAQLGVSLPLSADPSPEEWADLQRVAAQDSTPRTAPVLNRLRMLVLARLMGPPYPTGRAPDPRNRNGMGG